MPDPTAASVVVVGAGLSGLRAASRLHARGVDVVVLEARDRVGGRLRTEQVDGVAYDRGGQWVGPSQARMHALIAELGCTPFPTWSEGEALLAVGGTTKRYTGAIPPFPVLDLLRVQWVLSKLDRMTARVDPANPTAGSAAAAWDAETLRGFVGSRLGSRPLGALAPAIRVVFGAEMSELSLLWFLTYCAGSGGFSHLIEVEGGHQQDRLVEGMGALPARLAERLGDRVVLEAPVRRVEQTGDGVLVHTDRGRWTGRHLIVAVPPHLCAAIDWHPLLPAAREQLHQRMGMGSTTKVIATYDRPFWREAGLSGEVVCDSGPFSILYDNSPRDLRCGALVGFVVAKHARELQDVPDDTRDRRLLAALAGFFGPRAATPTQLLVTDWGRDPWSRGCPVGNAPPGLLHAAGPALRAPVGRIHWAGTETARAQPGFMEGALEAGDRAADEVLAARRSET